VFSLLFLLSFVGGSGRQMSTIIYQGDVVYNVSSNDTARFDTLAGNCSGGDFVMGVDNLTGAKFCATPAGGGDITAVLTPPDNLVWNGSISGNVYLATNWSFFNESVDLRVANVSGVGDGNNYTSGLSVYGATSKTLHLSRVGMGNLSVAWTDIDTDTDTTCSVLNSCTDVLYVNNQSDLEISESQIVDLNHTVDTNDSVRVGVLESFGSNLSGSDCSVGNYSYGVFSNGSLKCRDDISGSGGGVDFYVSQLNLTASSYSGNVTNGSLRGYQAANSICNASFADSHLCTVDEVMLFISSNDISYFSGTGWAAEGAPGYTVNANDCNGWTSSNGQYLASFWEFDSDGGGMAWLTNCGNSKPLVCCKY
jgi:hypothetical protein